MGILSNLHGFDNFAESVNIRAYSKTRKVRKSEDPLFFESRKELTITAEMVSVRPLPKDLEDKLSFLSQLFSKVDDPLLKRIYLLEYDIIVEKTVGDVDPEDVVVIHSLQEELISCITQAGITITELEKLCLTP